MMKNQWVVKLHQINQSIDQSIHLSINQSILKHQLIYITNFTFIEDEIECIFLIFILWLYFFLFFLNFFDF